MEIQLIWNMDHYHFVWRIEKKNDKYGRLLLAGKIHAWNVSTTVFKIAIFFLLSNYAFVISSLHVLCGNGDATAAPILLDVARKNHIDRNSNVNTSLHYDTEPVSKIIITLLCIHTLTQYTAYALHSHTMC